MIDREKLIRLLADRNKESIIEYFEEYNIYNISEAIQSLKFDDVLYLLFILPKNISGDLFATFDEEYKEQVLISISNEYISEILEHLYTDDVVDVLQKLDNKDVRRIIQSIPKESQADITRLLNYADETAGSIMTIDFIELKAKDTFSMALDTVKGQSKVAEIVTDCYIIGDDRKLLGKIKLKDLLFGTSDDIVEDVMEVNVVSVDVNSDQEEVLAQMQKYDLHVIPVINKEEKLVGIITIDDIIDVMEEEVTHDVHSMAGITKLEGSYLNTSVIEMAKSRIPWLLIIMVTAFFTEYVLEIFSVQLDTLPILAAFIPMTMGTAGNAANQATVMVIRAIVTDGIGIKDASKILFKESAVSFYLVVAMSIAIMLRLFAFPPFLAIDVMLSITAATVVSLFVGNVVGGLLPIVALQFKQDPAAMAGPLVTNIMDVASLVIYFVIAKLILGI